MSKHAIIVNKTFENNKASDYTEQIRRHDEEFEYSKWKSHYWGPPELSVFYGTELFNQADESQKLALNHLYWITQYNQTAATEANAILYNQITEGVFARIRGLDTLCSELSLETEQEHDHIHAFHTIGHRTRANILDFKRNILKASGMRHGRTQGLRAKTSKKTVNGRSREDNHTEIERLRKINEILTGKDGKENFSHYLDGLSQVGKSLPVQSTGLLGQVLPRKLNKLVTVGMGSSPFLACFFYTTRYLANILLKNFEYHYVRYYKDKAGKGETIPAPTAVSYLHLMDESFHTTISQVISQEIYKEFSKPSLYEILIANVILQRGQKILFSGISAVLPTVFKPDSAFLQPMYSALRSGTFGMKHEEAMFWLESCTCTEHDGFHANLAHHKTLLKSVKQAFAPLEYLWPINREARLLEQAADIQKTLSANRKAFDSFQLGLESRGS